MKNVLVIGAGRRVKGAVLPALGCLEDRFRVAGVVARTARELSYAGGRRTVTTLDSLDRVDFAAIDLIAMAVSITEVPRVLRDLAARPVGHAVLLIDTPVLPPTGLWASRCFSAFRRVLVAEDNLALPPFLLARRLIESGAIGALRRIFFFHSGFKHHALASLKMLAGGARIRGIVNRKFAGKLRQKEIDLDGGVSAVMYEPRDYATGKFLLVGEKGAIADYDYACAPVRRIGYQVDGAIYRGVTLDGEPIAPVGLDEAYLTHVGDDVFDGSPMNTMKLRGLMDLLVAALEERSPFHYDPSEGICDHLAIRLVDRIGYLRAPHRFKHLLPVAQRLWPGQ
jgi:hypothetical protein